MTKGVLPPPLPEDAPKAGEIYRHYKGGRYKIVLLADHSNDDEWMVVYEPLEEHPDAPYFTRPLREWSDPIDWEGKTVNRFTKESEFTTE